jgi:hypothetical protein
LLSVNIHKEADQIPITPIFFYVLGRSVCFLNASAVSDVHRISAMSSASLFLVRFRFRSERERERVEGTLTVSAVS